MRLEYDDKGMNDSRSMTSKSSNSMALMDGNKLKAIDYL
jgi:hypothetical protein